MDSLGNKKIMAKNIRKYMQINKVTQTDICRILKIPAPTFSDWVNAKTYPRIDKIELMANFFGINKSDLVEDKPAISVSSVKIPVLGYVAAGLPADAIENIVDWEEIPQAVADKGDYFGLVINGDSMEPRICKGDVVIVKKQSDAENGDIAIVIVNGDEGTCKKIIKNQSGINLVSLNPKYEPIFYTWEEVDSLPVVINGKVVELRGKF